MNGSYVEQESIQSAPWDWTWVVLEREWWEEATGVEGAVICPSCVGPYSFMPGA